MYLHYEQLTITQKRTGRFSSHIYILYIELSIRSP